MKKQSRKAFLATPLARLGIPKFASWVDHPFRELAQWEKCLENHKNIIDERETEIERLKRRAELYMRVQEARDAVVTQPQTVRQFIEKFHWKLSFKGSETGGLGPDSLKKFRKLVLAAGLTPDDWPVLAEGDLLGKLSKKKIAEIPIVYIRPFLLYTGRESYHSRAHIHDFLEITVVDGKPADDWKLMTVHDLLKINPETAAKAEYGKNFLETHWNALFAIHQKLTLARFGRTTPFMKWDPEKTALAKAKEELSPFNLPLGMRHKFAKIIVAKRWVV